MQDIEQSQLRQPNNFPTKRPISSIEEQFPSKYARNTLQFGPFQLSDSDRESLNDQIIFSDRRFRDGNEDAQQSFTTKKASASNYTSSALFALGSNDSIVYSPSQHRTSAIATPSERLRTFYNQTHHFADNNDESFWQESANDVKDNDPTCSQPPSTHQSSGSVGRENVRSSKRERALSTISLSSCSSIG